jgi:hypothetical protein
VNWPFRLKIPAGLLLLVSQGVHIMRGVRNQLLYFLMSDVFLLAKEEARYRQLTDVQEPKASYAAVLTGRCTGAETVACRCSNSCAAVVADFEKTCLCSLIKQRTACE